MVLRAAGVAFDRGNYTNETGTVTFDRVPLGPVFVQAQVYVSPNYHYPSGAATLTTEGETVAIDVRLGSPASLTGVVTSADGTPLPNAYGYVESLGSVGPAGRFFSYFDAGPDGRYQMTVPPGPLQAVAFGYLETIGNLSGFATVVIAPGGSATLDVVAAEARTFNVDLDGADGFRYDIRSDGGISDGGRADGSITDAYDTGLRLSIDGDTLCCSDAPRFELNGRQILIGPRAMESLLVTRKIFVPAAGGFARYLELITNPTSVPQTIQPIIRSNVGASSSSRVVVGPAATANTYAVTNEDPDDGGGRPALAHVFGGPGAPVTPDVTDFRNGEDDVLYGWTVTVQPGQTVALMHFAAQRLTDPGSNEAATRAQAEALVNLTDPAALEGLTDLERQQIVNFTLTVSPVLRGSIEGTAFGSDGTTGLPGVLVQVTDAATGFFLQAGEHRRGWPLPVRQCPARHDRCPCAGARAPRHRRHRHARCGLHHGGRDFDRQPHHAGRRT